MLLVCVLNMAESHVKMPYTSVPNTLGVDCEHTSEKKKSSNAFAKEVLVRETGFEPATC